MTVVSLKQFVEAGVHFGHQTRRWNPKMEKYIYGAKHGIHIIDLKQTLQNLKQAYEYTRKISEEGKSVLFVGTKDQARDILVEEAQSCDSFFINERWLGGLLTNFETVRQSVSRMQDYEEMAGPEGNYQGMIKKEALQIERKRLKLERSLGGVKDLQRLPGAVFIVDCMKEHIAVKEAQKLDIPIIAVVDTNCNPDGIEYPIPGNDDAPRAIRLYASVIATAIREGKALRNQRLHAEESIREEEAAEEKASKKIASDAKAKEAPEGPKKAKVQTKKKSPAKVEAVEVSATAEAEDAAKAEEPADSSETKEEK
ncbi:MAG: 30S ribosomal protein S2 [SAR324 cluster bacterium]|nr:30S ribosomal protein S2 [SAR324 cluster bacterium]